MTDADTTNTIRVNLGPRSYDISIVSGRLSVIAEAIEHWLKASHLGAASTEKALVITDRNVESPHAVAVHQSLSKAGWKAKLLVIDSGEKSKSIDVISSMYDKLVDLEADRRTMVVAVGGGVIGDAAGFAAATYARGLPFVQVPTTLLSHVDSSVGGKVGINHPKAKNLIGAFHQPLGVYCDTSTIDTLPDREYRSGLAEVVKYGVILDAEFFAYLEKHVDELNRRDPDALRHVIARSCRLKANVVEQDEYERTGLRAVLNYGHTFAHAYEALAGYGELLHGEAVAIGMVDAARLAARRKLIDESIVNRQTQLLESLGLPTSRRNVVSASADEIIGRMRLDKKTQSGKLRFVLPTKLGHVELMGDIPEADVREVLNSE
ncbi:MAG: 3-dehydroquinate synthase [Planctomycetaceae bacterium]